MGIFRRRDESESQEAAPPTGVSTGNESARNRVTEFIGVSDKLARWETRRTGLYEFRTTSGAPVYLHDTDLLRVANDVGSPGRLLLVFEYDPGWVPAELAATPAIEFECEDVTITEWEIDQEAAAERDAPQGQVSFFEWDGKDGFFLQTYSQYLAFTAARISVSVTATQRP